MKLKFFLLAALVITLSCSTSDDSPTQVNSNNNNSPSNNNNNNNNTNDPGTFDVAYQGSFVNAAHTTSGVAKINTDNTILRLENFNSENGPVLELYLTTDLTAQNYISLGELQGLDGNFDYTLPNNGIDFSNYKYVIVWCVEFSVNFGYAELQAN
ncbi:MAG TPA: DM13 domain-containing protein [Mangrovimonas sp.]|nr:DM13 domain-containing protein [Mangrovimonas sp.]